MSNSRGKALALLVAALLVGAGARADGDEPADCGREIAGRVQARYDGVQDLEARFTQKSRSVAFGGAGQEMEASGVALFAKPGRMRWTYEKPEPSIVVSDGQTLWIYDPTAREVQEFSVGQGFLSGTAVQFLLGEGRILEAFDVRAERCSGDPVRLFLTPREETSYESLELLGEPGVGRRARHRGRGPLRQPDGCDLRIAPAESAPGPRALPLRRRARRARVACERAGSSGSFQMMEAAFRVEAGAAILGGAVGGSDRSVGNPATETQLGRSGRRQATREHAEIPALSARSRPMRSESNKSSADPRFRACLPAPER